MKKEKDMKTELSTKDRLDKLKAALGKLNDGEFSGLTGKTLRTLIDSGVVTLAAIPNDDGLPFSYALDELELFKGVDSHKALAYMEANPRATASGHLVNDATIRIDTVVIGLRNKGNDLVTTGGPALTKWQVADFANTFHRADEFEIGSNFARAWFD